MLTIAFGFQKPENGDRGSVWFPAMEANIQQLADHTHDGSNSSKINPAALDKTPFITVKAAIDWLNDGNGNYHIDIGVGTGLPGGVNEVNNFHLKFYATATGEVFYPSWTRNTPQSFTIFGNNPADITVKYI